MTDELMSVLVELVTSGAFDDLDRGAYFAELSRSRLGWDADVELASMVIDELVSRELARPSEDGVSVPLHPVVRTTVLTLLAQLARRTGARRGLHLHPATSNPQSAQSLLRTFSTDVLPSAGHTVTLDLETVSVDLSRVPLEEVLAFRNDHGVEYRAYARGLRSLLAELSALVR